MNRSCGKTLSTCYVEVNTFQEASFIIQHRNTQVIKGRIVTVSLSPPKDLYQALFPSWRGWHRNNGSSSFIKQIHTGGGPGLVSPLDYNKLNPEGVFITRDEINAILLICRNYKVTPNHPQIRSKKKTKE